MRESSSITRNLQEEEGDQQDMVLRESKDSLRKSRRLRDLATVKSTRETKAGRINPLDSTKRRLRSSGKGRKKSGHKEKEKSYPKTEGIAFNEIDRRKSAGECLRCAWPSDRKGTHWVKDCIRPVKRDKGTASYPKANIRYQQEPSEGSSSNSEDSHTDTEID